MPKSEFDFGELGLKVLAGIFYLLIIVILVAASAIMVKLTLLILQV